MPEKICSKCSISKNLSEFYPQAHGKFGVYSECRECRNARNRARHRKYPWENIYYRAKYRCSNSRLVCYPNYGGKGIRFLLTKDQVKELWFRDNAYLLKEPSLDRTETNGHYEFSNCQFIELQINRFKDIVHPVIQIDKTGLIIKNWQTIKQARLSLNCAGSGIRRAIKSGKLYRGFYWRNQNAKM